MKILLSVVGIGLGHATRSHAVYEELIKSAKVKVMTWGSAHDYFKKMGIDSGTIKGYDYGGDEYTFSVFFNTLDSFRDPTKLRREYLSFARQADEFKPDIVVSDSDPNALFFANRRKLPNFTISNLITTIDNYECIPRNMRSRDLVLQNFMIKRLMDYIEKRTTKIFVPSFESQIRYREKVKYTDLIIRKKAKDLPSKNALKEKLGIDKDFYYVTIGGSDIEKYLFQVLRKTLPKFEDKYFIFSSNNMVNKVVEEHNMKIFPFIPNALEYIKASEGIISPAGHSTISEAISFKKPILTIPVINHIEQMVNAALLKRDGLGESCFFKQRPNPPLMKLSIEDFFKKKDKIENKLKEYKFFGKGAEQIAREIQKYY